MTRLASPRRWWGKSESDEFDPEVRPADTTTGRRREKVNDRDVGYKHSIKSEEATEKAAEAIREEDEHEPGLPRRPTQYEASGGDS